MEGAVSKEGFQRTGVTLKLRSEDRISQKRDGEPARHKE